MNVGFSLCTLFPGRVGGSESNVAGLLAEFAEGHGPERVTVLANRHVMEAYRDAERGPVALRELRSYRPGDSDATRLAAMVGARLMPRRAARDLPTGLDLVHYPVTVPIPATELPTVMTLHDVQHHDLPDFFGRGERAFRRWAYDGSARAADVVITSSEFSRGRIAERLGVDPARVEVVPLGIDAAAFAPEADPEADAAALEPLGLPTRYVAYPANMWPHKNHRRLVEGLAACADPSLELVLSGQDYGNLDGLMTRARELGVADRVHHLGHLPWATLPPLLRRAEAMVFPSLYEGFGTPPLEAMACACPVAASTAGSLPEVCGDAALGFDPRSAEAIATALERVTADSELRERLRAAGPARAERFTWRAAAERHAEIYERAVG